jgi:hypothetical protein
MVYKEDERTRGRITIVESKELLCRNCLVRNVKQDEEGTSTKDTPEGRLNRVQIRREWTLSCTFRSYVSDS